MAGIAIIGTGISGLTLALHLQRHGVESTVYSDRTADQHRVGRLPNAVTRFHPTRQRERELGVDHWDFPDFGVSALHLQVAGDPPVGFHGVLGHRASAVDFRIYLARLLEDYEDRGGHVVVGPTGARDVVDLARRHDLVVVAAGRGSMGELFPRDPHRSPFAQPQRVLTAGLYHGIAFPDPLGVSFNVAPGVGEIFQAPVFSFDGRVSAVLVEAVPGGPLEVLRRLRYEDDPVTFEATLLRLLEQFAPELRERVDTRQFGLTRPLDLLQGEITPTVRRAWARLDGDRYAFAVGDAWILNDPIVGQGANLGSHSAWALGEAIVAAEVYDGDFCRDVEHGSWAYAESVTPLQQRLPGAPAGTPGRALGGRSTKPARRRRAHGRLRRPAGHVAGHRHARGDEGLPRRPRTATGAGGALRRYRCRALRLRRRGAEMTKHGSASIHADVAPDVASAPSPTSLACPRGTAA